MVRHSHQDALDEPTFERLVEAVDELDPRYQAEAMYILIAGGRLGMRAGEICHSAEEWVDWESQMIRIPEFDNCNCGYCSDMARQSANYDTPVTYEESLAERWQPKTSKSARAIPFDFNERVRATVETFFDQFDEYPHSRVSVNRRIDRLAEAAGMDVERIYPHALRATAATYHAFSGLSAAPLQAMLGWEQIETANKYIRLSGGATADALRDVHAGD